MSLSRLAGAALLAPGLLAVLAGCAQPQTRTPLLTLDRSTCVATLDLASAQAVVVDSDKPATAMVEYNAPCWQPEGGDKTAYSLFKLPVSTTALIVDVTSVPLGLTLFSPQAALLDENGAETRRFAGDRFVFRNDQLTLGLRPATTERYLVIFSNPALVGQDAARLMGMVQANAVYAGAGAVMIYSGSEVNRQLTHAHNGMITVAARPVPTAK